MARHSGSRPNIVIVHGHDMGRHFGVYGRGIQTPNVARMARNGVLFHRAFTPSPQCSPSRAAMATGRYPHRNGMMGLAHMGWSISDQSQSLPARMRKLGYSTHLFGEQHEARLPAQLGFDAAHATGWPQLARDVSAAFAQHLPEIEAARPFFASVGFFEAHRPFDHPGYSDEAPESVQPPPYLPDEPAVRADVAALNARIKAVDEGLGMVLQALQAHGYEQETIVVFTTDHGIAFPRAKGTLYDPGIETALIIKGPGMPAGIACDGLVANLDLYPTLVELAGGDPGEGVDGLSLLPYLQSDRRIERQELMCEMTWHDRYSPVRGIRTERWKYIKRFQTTPAPLYLPADVEESPSGSAFRAASFGSPKVEELFDLEADPDETRNLLGDDSYAQILSDLRSRLAVWMRETSDPLVEWPST